MKSYSVFVGLSLLCALPVWGDSCYQGQGPTRFKESLELTGVKSLTVGAGVGSLTIVGSQGKQIEMEAEAYLGEATEYRLKLERQGEEAVIQAIVDGDRRCRGKEVAYIDITVRVPEGIRVDAKDGSGSVKVEGLKADLHLEDGSGDAEILGVAGRVNVEDGSGSLTVSDVQGETRIEDGSGSLVVSGIGGNALIEDGSGSLVVRDVQGDLRVDDGSGDINISRVSGTVTIDDGSGDILVEQAGSVELSEPGSGSVTLSAIGKNHLK